MYTQFHIYLSPWPVISFIRSRWHHGRGSFDGWTSLSQGEAGPERSWSEGWGRRDGEGAMRVPSRGGGGGEALCGDWEGRRGAGWPAARVWVAGGGRRSGGMSKLRARGDWGCVEVGRCGIRSSLQSFYNALDSHRKHRRKDARLE